MLSLVLASDNEVPLEDLLKRFQYLQTLIEPPANDSMLEFPYLNNLKPLGESGVASRFVDRMIMIEPNHDIEYFMADKDPDQLSYFFIQQVDLDRLFEAYPYLLEDFSR